MSQRCVFRVLTLACIGALFALVLLPISAQNKKGKKYALLVGVSTYKHSRLPTLAFTGNDVEELATVLLSKRSGFDEVRVMSTKRGDKNADDAPTTANILKAVDELVRKKGKDDTILIGLSGHGVQLEVEDPDGKGKDKTYPYFCPSDADFLDVSYSTGRSKSLVLLDDLFAKVGKCGATNRLVLIDACRNEVKAGSSTRNVDVDQVTVPRGVGVLFSCKSGEKAWETDKLGKGHGVFFYHVIEGLKGEAKNKRGQVTWDSLASYVRTEVAEVVPELIRKGARQTPHGILNLDSLPVLAIIAREDAGKTPIAEAKEGTGDTPLVKRPKAITNSIGMKLVYIKPGKFRMGSPKDEQDDAIADYEKLAAKKATQETLDFFCAEGPVHEVKISQGFYMGVYEVAQHEYEKVMGSNPSYYSAEGKGKEAVKEWKTGWFPVENVSYEDAEKFCKKLSAKAGEKGRVYRLPTEAEWEYACRAGTNTPFHYGESLSSDQANFNGEYPYGGAGKSTNLKRTCEVGSFRPNAFGLYDMHGNVWEWCSDWYDKDYYDKGDNSDPKGPNKGTYRVLRGGSWNIIGWDCRSAYRNRDSPGYRYVSNGFRVVCVSP